MKTRITDLAVKAAVVAGLAAGLAFGSGLGIAGADHSDADNYFDLYPGPPNGRTDIDPYDPYAPVDLGSTGGGSQRRTGVAADVVTVKSEASEHCLPQRCRAW